MNWSLNTSPVPAGRGPTVMYPDVGGSTAVRLSNTALTPLVGMPATPVTCRSWLARSSARKIGFVDDWLPSPIRIGPLVIPVPLRVSSIRVGLRA